MAQNADHFDEFEPHTRLKHEILDSYIIAWGMKLLMWGAAGDRLAIVDGFAGPGHDSKGNEGSPIIAARRAFELMGAARNHRPNIDPKVHVFAIEKVKNRYDSLCAAMEPLRRLRPDLISVLHGELSDHIDAITATVGAAPTFYFLDPFGIKGLDARTYPKALSAPHNELFALFSDIGANRLHGLVTAERVDAEAQVAAIATRPSLFPDLDAADMAAVRRAAEQTNNALDASTPASRAHLTRALGNERWVAELAATPADDKPDAFLRLFQQALLQGGANHVLTVPMRNDSARRVYSLVHASKSAAGFMTMKECVSSGLNGADLPPETVDRIRADLSIDVADLVRVLRQVFSGSTIAWALKRHGLKDLLLRETPLFQFQCDELKTALKTEGILRRVDKKETCVFPRLPD